MSQDEKERKVRECFPILGKMKDRELQAKVIRCWVKMWEESKWKDLRECPFTPPFPEISLVDHVNCVGDLVLTTADVVERHNPQLKLDRDYLITGVKWGEMLKLMPHSTYGAFMALAQGLSPRVANIIMAHTRMAGTLPASPEATLLHYMDYGLADVLRAHRGLALIMDGGPKLGK
jgi:hypothetical protein